MIALLTGQIVQTADGHCVIDVQGVGYLVQASSRTLGTLPRPPEIARLLIETIVREDAISLYGFAHGAERDWFNLLTTVQGVGAKVALGLLSALAPGDIATAIAAGDKTSLGRAPGIGPKLAQRLISELAGKVGALPATGSVMPQGLAVPGVKADLVSALANLGYKRAEAEPAALRVLGRLGETAGLEDALRAALKELAR